MQSVAAEAHHLHSEDVIKVSGHVARADSRERRIAKLPTGEIELVAEKLEILNRAEPLPFPLDEELSNEDLAAALSLFRSAPAAACAQSAPPSSHHQSDARLPRRAGFSRSGNADSLEEHAGRRARFPRPQPSHAGKILRAAAGAAAIQTAAHGRRSGKIFPDRKMFPRRRFARRSTAGIHPNRYRSVICHAG